MCGYVPPQLRDKINYKPKNLTYKPKIIWSEVKSMREVFEEYRKENEGKVDQFWQNFEYEVRK